MLTRSRTAQEFAQNPPSILNADLELADSKRVDGEYDEGIR